MINSHRSALRFALLLALPLSCASSLPEHHYEAPTTNGPVLHVYPKEGARRVAILVPGLGFDHRVYLGPSGKGLARAVWNAGYHLILLQNVTSTPRLRSALEHASRQFPGLPRVGIGHGLGGTALRAASRELQGLVLLRAPIGFGGESRSVRRLLRNPPRAWTEVADTEVLLGTSATAARSTGLGRQLIDPGLLATARNWGVGRNTPGVPAQLERALRHPERPILLVLAQASGWAPPWHCDPVGLGIREKHIQRWYFARAHRHELDYNHLDLLLHPDAKDDVFPPIQSWLENVKLTP